MAGHCIVPDCTQESRGEPPVQKVSDAADAVCSACNGRGYLFPHGNASGWICVERCDSCRPYWYDEEAAAALGEELSRIDPRYAIVRAYDPDRDLDDGPGPAYFAVVKYHNGSDSFRPIGPDVADALAVKLGIIKPQAAQPDAECCPRCGSTDLCVSLQAAFRWNGKDPALGPEALVADEFPVEDAALVVCDKCEHMWRARQSKKG